MTQAALTQSLTEKLGKETAEGLMTQFETVFHDKKVDLVTKGDLRAEVAEAKTDIIRYMFAFWIGQVLVTLGMCLLIFQRLK